jgi:two-component system, cell cycle sensor histidine kinase and response regulator CckA
MRERVGLGTEGSLRGDDIRRQDDRRDADPAEALRLESATLLEEAQVLANLGTCLYEVEEERRIWSYECARILGVEWGVAIEKETYYRCVHPEDREIVRAEVRAAFEGSASIYEVDHRVLHPDGSVHWVLGRSRIVRNAAGRPVRVIGVLQDVTDRHQSLEKLRASEESYRRTAAVVQWSHDAVIGVDRDGLINSWNRGASLLFGYEEHEVLGRAVSVITPEALRPETRTLLDRCKLGEPVEHHETVRRRKDGSKVEVSLTLSPIRDSESQIVGISGIVRDLTDRRRSEVALRRAEQQLRDAQKMEAVGLLAGGIAHDFNNTLSAIVGYTELVLENLPLGDPIRVDIVEVRKAGASAVQLTRQLLALSRRQVLSPRVIDLNQIVLHLERMVRRLIGAHVVLAFDLSSELGRVSADPGQIEQVIMNLVLNARDAMGENERGTLSISTHNQYVEGTESEPLNITPGRYVMLSVRDTGSGMNEATIERIFEPFFTTKEKGKGTGLGLSTALGIVQQSGGAIGLESELGEGTLFRIYLPRTDRPVQSAYSIPPARVSNRSWETILLVEDEDQVRALARTALKRHGYQVLEAEQGEQALALCEQHVGSIHLLLTDVVMPRMGGRELAERATVLRPEMKVLFMSGYANDDIIAHGVMDESICLMQKPITPSGLARRVREVLDQP